MADQTGIILYHYLHSPYARRIVWYLTLRGIPYSQCLQPIIMPRPDVARLGISYRRIPLLSVGRDVYLDTRLQLLKLESMFSHIPKLGSETPADKALQGLLSSLMNDSGVFSMAALLLPPDLPTQKDPRFIADRKEFSGGKFNPEAMKHARPQTLLEFKQLFTFLEETLLKDGRDWILGSNGPGLADIEAIWVIHWLVTLPGALPTEIFSTQTFPRVYAWMDRFNRAVKDGKRKLGEPKTVSGQQAASQILNSAFLDDITAVNDGDIVFGRRRMRQWDEVTVWPTDSGSSHKESGRLLGLDDEQVVIEVGDEDKLIRVHAPRHGFGISPAPGHNKL